MQQAKQIPDSIFRQVVSLVNKAKAETAAGDYPLALQYYREAEQAIPEPATQYTGTCFLFFAQGKLFMELQQENNALPLFIKAGACADGVHDAQIAFQCGLIYLHQGDTEKARTHLEEAYRLAGETVFTAKDSQDRLFFTRYIFKRSPK
ncbi:MAG: tetratricopeptide repeat protein [Dinghuibacter sp.]|nr:tetratricopeptide repeat protein [Dinghuibacter sp.]